MKANELFVLANDIQFIPADTLNEQVKRSFDHDANDIVITHLHTRKRSKVLSEEFAALIKEFETPASWASAIINFSLKQRKDAQQLADEVYPLLKEMKYEGYLIPYIEGEENKKPAILQP